VLKTIVFSWLRFFFSDFRVMLKAVYLLPPRLDEPDEPDDDPPDGALPPLERDGEETAGLEELEGGGLLLLDGAE